MQMVNKDIQKKKKKKKKLFIDENKTIWKLKEKLKMRLFNAC